MNSFAATKTTPLSKTKITLSCTTYTYDGTAKRPAVTVKYGSKKLKKGTDYTVSYSNNVKAGKATVNIKGIGKYSGVVKKNFKINGKVTKNQVVISSSPYWARDYFDITYDGYTGKIKSVQAYQREKDAFQSCFRANGIRKTGTWTYRSVWVLTTPSIFGFDASLVSVESKYRIDAYGKLIRTYRKCYPLTDLT